MHSTLARAQSVFGFFTTIAFVIALLISSSDLLFPRTPSSTIAPKDISVKTSTSQGHTKEYAVIRFTLTADLSTLFTWNTKQVFVWVSASWPNGTVADGDRDDDGAMHNEAVIWDTIITNPSADFLLDVGPAARRKLAKSKGNGRGVDGSRGILDLKNQRPKYYITAPTGRIAEMQGVVLKVHYNVQPWVGVLTWRSEVEFGGWRRMVGGVSQEFALPGVKGKAAGKV